MHGIAYVAGLVDLLDLTLLLDEPHGYHCLDELLGSFAAHTVKWHPEHPVQADHVLVAVRREEMHLASACLGLGDILVQLGERECPGNSHRSGLVSDQRLRAHPDDIVDIDIIAEDDLFARLQVDDGSQIGVRKAEIVVESTVLAVAVGIAGVVDSRLPGTKEQKYTGADLGLQGIPPADVDFFCKHIVSDLKLIFKIKPYSAQKQRNVLPGQ